MQYPLLIEWHSHNEVGIAILDEQHRGLVSIINSFAFSILNQNTEFIINGTFSMMATYTKIHFRTEEALLQTAGYEELEEHRKVHKALVRESFTMANRSLLLSDPELYLHFLEKWWMRHINENDKKYANFLQEYSKKAYVFPG